MKGRITVFCLLFAVHYSLCTVVFAESGFKKDQPIEITADSLTYDKPKDTYHAEGNVVIIQGKSSIRADKATVDMAASHATAIGNVESVSEEGNILRGDSLEFDIDAKAGVVINGRLFFKKGNLHVVASEIKKTGDESYSAHRGFFTTCDCAEDESPAWGFYSSDTDVTVGEYLTAWNSLFYIKKAPVFYFPYLAFPVKRERQTGFLTPKAGYSRLRGFKFDNSFFWAISESQDATFYFDIESRRGLGKGMEYRYILSRQSEGEFYFYHFKETDIDRVREFRKGSDNLSRPKTADDDRWFLEYKHTELLPYDIGLKADIKKVSDDEYFIDFGKNTNERSLESLESNISMTKTWNKFNLVTQFRYFDNLLVEENRATLQRLPEITLTGADRQIMDTPFHFSMESSFVNFERKQGSTGQRVDVHPTVSLPLNPGGYFEFKPWAGARETLYWVKNPPQDKFHDRASYDLNADLTTTFVRIYSWDENNPPSPPLVKSPSAPPFSKGDEGGLQKVRHTIRPKIVYTYIPEQVQDDLPVFDGIDRIAQRNDFTYSLNTILTGKSTDSG
ncbi:MAG: LPS-assembly protein LptD, partial [Deltaproteobacteria bacterium]|nr:LPS-assembly protein LptD [Deltaproteobacteria bacterium]